MRCPTLVLAMSLAACAPRSAAQPLAHPSALAAESSTQGEPPARRGWTLRFDREGEEAMLLAEGPAGATRRLALVGASAPPSAAATDALGDTAGIVLALADVIAEPGGAAGAVDDDDDRTGATVQVELEPSEVCPKPWLLDLGADTPRPSPRLHGAAATVRVGCGRVSFADFDGEAGPERVVYYGESGFDTRVVASQIAVLRTKVEQQFGSHPDARWVTEVVIAPMAQPAIESRAVATPFGVRMVVDGNAGWGALEHLALGSTLARTWLLGLLARELPQRDRDDVIDLALLDGVARGIAREAAFALGLIDPNQYVEDLDRAEAIIAARPSGAATEHVDARDLAAWAAEFSVQTAMLAWRLRARQTSDVIPRRIVKARRDHGDEPRDALTVWRALTADLLGEPVTRPSARVRVHPQIPVYEARTLGRCVVAGRTRDRTPELGLTMAHAGDDAGRRGIPAVAPDGAAARAGVRVGDRLDGIQLADDLLRFVVTREHETLLLDTAPSWRVVVRPAWQRRPKVADADCYPPP